MCPGASLSYSPSLLNDCYQPRGGNRLQFHHLGGQGEEAQEEEEQEEERRGGREKREGVWDIRLGDALTLHPPLRQSSPGSTTATSAAGISRRNMHHCTRPVALSPPHQHPAPVDASAVCLPTRQPASSTSVAATAPHITIYTWFEGSIATTLTSIVACPSCPPDSLPRGPHLQQQPGGHALPAPPLLPRLPRRLCRRLERAVHAQGLGEDLPDLPRPPRLDG